MPSSVAAACSSKLKPWQNFLRSARPQARLMRLPNGACSTSCMPPDSSKKRSSASVSIVGTTPRLRFASAEVAARSAPRPSATADSRAPAARSRRRARRPCAARPVPGSSKSTAARSCDTAALISSRARRRLAEPERHRRRLALRVGDAHHAVADAQDAPRGVAELEHVARQRFDGEVLVQRADEVPLGLEHARGSRTPRESRRRW